MRLTVSRRFLTCSVLAGGLSCLSFADETVWYTVSYGGQKVGYSSTTYRPSETLAKQKLLFKRLGQRLTMIASSTIRQDSTGHIVSFRGEMSSSMSSTVNEGTIEGTTLKLKATAAGKTYTREIPLTSPLLGIAAQDALTVKALIKPGDEVKFTTIEPVSGTVIAVDRVLNGFDVLESLGHKTTALEVHEKMSAAGIDHTIWLDTFGHMIRSKDASPLGEAILARASEREALAAGEGGELRAEVYGRSTAKTNIRLPDPRSIQRVVLKLTNLRPELGWPQLASETQKVLKQDAKTTIVEVRQASIPLVSKAANSDQLKPYLTPNAIIQSDDAGVQKLARSIVGAERDPWTAAKKLRDWEATHMHFDAGIAVAPSSEVARDHRGTCFAYSSLLAGMCRSIGIPSRFVMGFGYVERMYGGHAWVDVRIGGQWIPLDAALTEPGPADAARLRCVTSSLDEGYADIQTGGKLYGNVDIAILEYTTGGKTVRVPSNAKPYEVRGATYRNPWLGIQESLPVGFHFHDLNASYPDPTIFSATNGTEKIVLQQMPTTAGDRSAWPDSSLDGSAKHRIVAGCHAAVHLSKSKAEAAVRDGLTVWIFEATGKHAKKTLSAALAGWKHIPMP